jgi:hypothetical protein
MIAEKLATMTRSDAGKIGADVTNKTASALMPLPKVSVPDAAKSLNVSPRLVNQARKVRNADPEKAKEVEEGKKTIGQALSEIKAKAQEDEEKKYVDPMAVQKGGLLASGEIDRGVSDY